MTDTSHAAALSAERPSADPVAARLKRRHAAERRFRAFGLGAVLFALGFLGILLTTIVSHGITAFVSTYVKVEIHFDPALLGIEGTPTPEAIAAADYRALIRDGLSRAFPEVQNRTEQRQLLALVSGGAEGEVRDTLRDNPSLLGQSRTLWLLANDDVDMVIKGHAPREPGIPGNRLSEAQGRWLTALESHDAVKTRFNTILWTSGDSRQPEQAGLWGAVVGSIFSLTITLLVSFPLGVATAIYLEEFAPKNRWTDLIEVNINNLAAVPSVVFGLLGLAVFLNGFGLPRSAPLVGGLVLALICLPTIIIAARAAMKAVPPSIREAAAGLGASRLQVVTDHVLPLSMPGVLTGTILGMAHALGETAPLLMIGMVAFIVDIPSTPLDPAAVLPVQVYLWADSPERAFVERTSAAIMVLLLFLTAMNLIAIMLRKKFERKW